MSDVLGSTSDEDGYLRSTRWRFSISRLIVATAVAPLPFWLFPVEGDASRISLAVSSTAIAGAIVVVRARDLPRINLTLLFGFVTFLFSFCCCPLHSLPLAPAPGLACSFIVAFFLTESILPSRTVQGRPPQTPPAIRVLQTGMVPFLVLGIFVVLMLVSFPSAPGDDGRSFAILLSIHAMLLVLLGLNVNGLCQGGTDSLDQRPGLGYWYEATTILLPTAAIIGYLRYCWSVIH